MIAGERIFAKEYKLKGKAAWLEVEAGKAGSDVFLNAGTRKNLSYYTPGENLFPKMFVKKENYSVTWINYRKNDVKLNFYDSFSDKGRALVSGNFEFVSSDTSIVFDRGRPRMIVFRAVKERDNEDIFVHDLNTGRTERITSTPGNENRIIVENDELDGRNFFILKTQTLKNEYTYIIDLDPISSSLKEKKEIIRFPQKDKTAFTDEEFNTLIGFGDSITLGKMRMNDLEGVIHSDLTYWAKVSEYFNENYGDTYTINLGVSGETSLEGTIRMDEELLYEKGYYFLVLFGTNDVTSGIFSSTSTSKNIQWILENARDNYEMFPVVSTVPPQKLYLEGVQFFKEQTEKLNEKLKLMADANDFPYINTYDAFFDHQDGWEAMLEDIKGNHPSPAGHQVMADMVIPILLSLTPEIPSNVVYSANTGGNSFNVSCTLIRKFDFSHYKVKFGFSANDLDREMDYTSNFFTVYFYPFYLNLNRTVYFKMQSVLKDGNASDFSMTYSVHLK